MAEDQPTFDFNPDKMEDYSFKFDLGRMPEFELKPLDKSDVFNFYVVPVPEEEVNARFDYMRNRRGKREETDDIILNNDLVTFNAVELDGDAPKNEGWKTTFSILVSRINKAVMQDLLTKKKGDTVRFNVFELENATSREYVKKYLLNFTQADLDEGAETGEMYEAVIEKVTRLTPAELNQEFFEQAFPDGGISNEAEAKELIRKNLGLKERSSSNILLFDEIKNVLLERHREDAPLPDKFLKKWLAVSGQKEAKNTLNNYDLFADDTRWALIKSKYNTFYDLQVNNDEVRDAAVNQVTSYFGGYYYEGIEGIVDRIMENKDQVNQLAVNVLADKLFAKLKEDITLNEVAVSKEELDEKISVLRVSAQSEAPEEAVVMDEVSEEE
jgi:trigger factor